MGAIFRITKTDDHNQEIEPYVREYEQHMFLGPNSLCLSRNGMLYFSDSGPLGETSIQNPKGSVFAISPSTQLLIPLALNVLAHPCEASSVGRRPRRLNTRIRSR